MSLGIDHTVVIAAPAARVFEALFDAASLRAWWQVETAIAAPRLLAPFAVTWPPTPHADYVLGHLGGIFHGVVVDIRPPQEAYIAECYWLPPEGAPVGPMALTFTCVPEGAGTRLRVRQTGFEEGARWRRYYEIFGPGLRVSLEHLKALLESGLAVADA